MYSNSLNKVGQDFWDRQCIHKNYNKKGTNCQQERGSGPINPLMQGRFTDTKQKCFKSWQTKFLDYFATLTDPKQKVKNIQVLGAFKIY